MDIESLKTIEFYRKELDAVILENTSLAERVLVLEAELDILTSEISSLNREREDQDKEIVELKENLMISQDDADRAIERAYREGFEDGGAREWNIEHG
mgnify:CR=1 FL=1